MLNIENVSFTYLETKTHSLKNINLHASTGECILLCGKSGCGKTTVTKLINGLIPHFSKGQLDGKVTAAKMDVANTEIYKLSLKIGSVFQNPKSQFFNIDSDSELAFGLENQGLKPEIMKETIEKTINDLHIEKLIGRNLFEMSGGEKQALAFASIYAMNPDIYVLDEPSANLDAKAIELLKKQLKKIKQQGKTILIAEHRLYYLTDIIDKVVFMENGQIDHLYTSDEFYNLDDSTRKMMGLRTLQPPKKNEELIHKTNQIIKNPELEVIDLCCKYGKKTVIDNISFSASSGDIIGVLGENGAGKTTLMRCLAGLLKESSGSIRINGVKTIPKQRIKYHYMIMQDVGHQLFAESVLDECQLTNEDIPEEKILKVLNKFSLANYKNRHPLSLSGGQKQRLAIAVGTLTDKKILIFDEPTSGLDYIHMCVVSNMIKDLSNSGHIIFIVTHDIEFLEKTCTKGIIIQNNVLIKEGNVYY